MRRLIRNGVIYTDFNCVMINGEGNLPDFNDIMSAPQLWEMSVPQLREWYEKLHNADFESLKKDIDVFVEMYGIDYQFYSQNGDMIGDLLYLAASKPCHDIVKYLVEEKNANIYSINNSSYTPIVEAILTVGNRSALYYSDFSDKDQCTKNAFYLLNKCSNEFINTLLKKLLESWRIPLSGVRKMSSYETTILKELLKRGAWCDCDDQKILSQLITFQNELLQEDKTLVRVHHQLKESSELLYHEVSEYMKHAGGEIEFYLSNKIFKPAFEIDETLLNTIISKLERQNDSMAFFICGLLLEGRIENEVPERYLDDLNSDAYQVYIEKRSHDAIDFYLKMKDQLPDVVEHVLWHLKVTGAPSVRKRIKQYAVYPSEQTFQMLDFFSRRSSVKVLVSFKEPIVSYNPTS